MCSAPEKISASAYKVSQKCLTETTKLGKRKNLIKALKSQVGPFQMLYDTAFPPWAH